jgi:hypothetical protein
MPWAPHPVRLGPRILRADTAAVAALTLWQAVRGLAMSFLRPEAKAQLLRWRETLIGARAAIALGLWLVLTSLRASALRHRRRPCPRRRGRSPWRASSGRGSGRPMSIPQSGGGPIESEAQLAEYSPRAASRRPTGASGPSTRSSAICRDTLRPLPYDGPRSIRAMLEGLRDRFGWAPVRRASNMIGLTRDGANVSLEPGGQLELSGAPLETIHQTCDEVNEHLAR